MLTLFNGLNLQLFADGGAASGVTGTAAGSQGTEGVNAEAGNGDGAQVADAQNGQQNDTVDLEKEFDELIKSKYKDQYNSRVQNTVQSRLKNAKETADKYNSQQPIMEKLAAKYGVKDVSDVKAIMDAMDDDNSYYEEEALEKGVTVEQLKEFKKMERENAEFKRQAEERNTKEQAEKIYAGWLEQEKNAQAKYPGLSLKSECENPQFVQLLKVGIDVETAYSVIHRDEILKGAIQATAQQTEKKVTDKIMANGMRPTENGTSSGASAVIGRKSAAQMSKAEREDLNRRAARGERITF